MDGLYSDREETSQQFPDIPNGTIRVPHFSGKGFDNTVVEVHFVSDSCSAAATAATSTAQP